MKPLKAFLCHPWLTQRAQFLLGGLFILAAWPKLMDPPGFAKALWAYSLFPAWSILPLALVLPWLELVCGAMLALGLWVKAATAWLGLLLLGFTLALSINLARRHPVDCGCFNVGISPSSTEERLRDMRLAILRDLGMLALAALILANPGGKAIPGGRQQG
ncbi:MAG: DoxX family protein [Holophagaceae bacterium]|nr:DoxX family protein [Holophagaceae bacterium]